MKNELFSNHHNERDLHHTRKTVLDVSHQVGAARVLVYIHEAGDEIARVRNHQSLRQNDYVSDNEKKKQCLWKCYAILKSSLI